MLHGMWSIVKVVNTETYELGYTTVKLLKDDDIIPCYFIKKGYGFDAYTYPFFHLKIHGYQELNGSFLTYEFTTGEVITLSNTLVEVDYRFWKGIKTQYGIEYTED